jgi:DNA polymerase III gamma/tau subunit
MIARAADGSMRDSQSLFDQIASYASGNITEEHAREMLGTIDSSIYFDFLTFLLEGDFAELLARIERLDNDGVDFIVFTQGLAELLRNIVLLSSGAAKESLELTQEDSADVMSFLDPSSADGFSLDDAVILLNILADVLSELHDARNPRRVFELALFRMVKWRELISPAEIVNRLEGLERRLSGGAARSKAGEEIRRRPGPHLPIEIAASREQPVAAHNSHENSQAQSSRADTQEQYPHTAQNSRTQPQAQSPSAGTQEQYPHTAQNSRVQPQAQNPSAGAQEQYPHTAQNFRAQPQAQSPSAGATASQSNTSGEQPGVSPAHSMEGSECLALVREYSHLIDHENPILSRVLNEVVRAEIINNTLLFWLLPKNKFHKSSIDQSYPEQILAFFSDRAGAPLRLECRFTDEGEVSRYGQARSQSAASERAEVSQSSSARSSSGQSSSRESLIDTVRSSFSGEIVSEERIHGSVEIDSGEYEDTDINE